MAGLNYREFSSKPAKLVAILFVLTALNCLYRAYFQRGAVGDAAMIALYFMYWPASALVGALLNPLVDFVYQSHKYSGNIYFIFETTNALVVGTIWNYFLAKTIHWLAVCIRSRHIESGDHKIEDGE